MIRKGTSDDIHAIINITAACATHMINNHIYQWNASYPNKEGFKKDVTRGELYVMEVDTKVIACITLSDLMDAVYLPVSWLTPNKNNLYVHRLAVHPEHQGKGHAQKLMDFAKTFAIKNNYSSIRLDTFSQNPKNLNFYELRGFKRLEKIFFPNQSHHPFYCYELVL
ncbi:GNAT family N-acetyltransferase [Snuella sedimenti]|uniref:GNAT family N-acetyltransferase n=1 Tax=Snuella sedimenti TaxID=2798802 RepID=A0A8J7LZ20_9FLAO|nr:GNAT family N-acetyltransferase [Snuella sedimenti]MBJ6369476.1 GNAT family N-acetyltransferase [Snuella sedimenti]